MDIDNFDLDSLIGNEDLKQEDIDNANEYRLNDEDEIPNFDEGGDIEEVQEETNSFENHYVEDYEKAKENYKENKDFMSRYDKIVKKNLAKRDENSGLSINQLEAIEMICMGKTNKDIAEHLGVSSSTVVRWKKEENFIKTLDEIRKDYVRSFQLKLLSEVPNAIKNIVNIMNDEDAPYKDRVTASRTILEMSNIKNGGIKEDEKDVNIGQAQIVFINPNPPQQTPMEKAEEIKDVDFDNIIDVDVD
jgi:predicted HicB family RNase H-like nuclease